MATVWNRSFSEEKEPKRLPAILAYRMGYRSQEPGGLSLGWSFCGALGCVNLICALTKSATPTNQPKPFTKNGHGMRSIPESSLGPFLSTDAASESKAGLHALPSGEEEGEANKGTVPSHSIHAKIENKNERNRV
ncbi:MAG: hypothetical protein K2G93_03475 [Rikenella sp.]|nr:hypothetical protein [Rikenella sp.]